MILDGKKTYLAAGGALLVAIGTNMVQWAEGQPVNIELVVGALTALALIFLRKGVKNGKVE